MYLQSLPCVGHIGCYDITTFKLEGDKAPFDVVWIWVSRQICTNCDGFVLGEQGSPGCWLLEYKHLQKVLIITVRLLA